MGTYFRLYIREKLYKDAEAKGRAERGERGLFLVRKMMIVMVPSSGIFPI